MLQHVAPRRYLPYEALEGLRKYVAHTPPMSLGFPFKGFRRPFMQGPPFLKGASPLAFCVSICLKQNVVVANVAYNTQRFKVNIFRC